MDPEIRESFAELKAMIYRVHERFDEFRREVQGIEAARAACQLEHTKGLGEMQRQVDDARRGSGMVAAGVSGGLLGLGELVRALFK